MNPPKPPAAEVAVRAWDLPARLFHGLRAALCAALAVWVHRPGLEP